MDTMIGFITGVLVSYETDPISSMVLIFLIEIIGYTIIGYIIYQLIKRLVTYGINYYFDMIDYRAKEFADAKERIRRAGLDADLRRINQQLDEMEKQEKE